MVMEVVPEDMGESNAQCTNHPYKNIAAPGGICAFCLQEKLRKLVSSSFTTAVFPSSSSSPSPSFRSDFDSGGAARHLASSSRLPFVLTHRKKKKHHGGGGSSNNTGKNIIFKRSKSTVTPRRGRGAHFLLDEKSFQSPYRKVFFWSFFYTSKHRKCERSEKSSKDLSFTPAAPGTGAGSSSVGGVAAPARSSKEDFDEDGSPDDVGGLDRKVSRSRSVGCGSRSFSGDFFERISTGFGDCTLRRVESQREGKSKVQPSSVRRNGQDCIKERVRCGSGFIITSSSSSPSSLVSEDNNNNNNNGKSISVVNSSSHGRSRSWGWALASPMRAFSKPNSAGKGDAAAKHVTPDLAAIPSVLAVIS